MPDPVSDAQIEGEMDNRVTRLSLATQHKSSSIVESDEEIKSNESSDSEVEDVEGLEFRIVKRDDPEAYTFNTPQFSAHKLPKDVVDAGAEGEVGLREFMGRWRDIVRMQEREEVEDD